MVIVNDISKQMQLKKAEAINEYKDNLLATVTHDLKTPLNSMMAMLESTKLMNNIEDIKKINQLIMKNA